MTRITRTVLAAAVLAALAVTPASASHTHVLQLGNGQCVLLAPEAGEEDVVLPVVLFESNPNVTIVPTTDRMHPLHVLVHTGEAGQHITLAVAGSPVAATLCASGIVND